MRERRSAERYILKAACRVILGQAEHSCIVWDRSKTGARLMEFGDITLPSTLAIHINGAAGPQYCRLIWQSDGQAGVAFEQAGV